MKIGIDLHGVIDNDPEFFKKLLTCMNLSDIEVCVVSGPPKEEIIEELKDLGFEKGIHYKEVYSIVDFLKESGVEMWQDENNRWWSNEPMWVSSKSRICDKYSIPCLIDDKEMYRPGCDFLGIKFILFKQGV